MANLPYVAKNPNKVFSALKMYSRAGQFPLDPTSVFETKAQAEAYIKETGSYAYAGQVLAVLNGEVGTSDNIDVTLYVIRKDRTLQEMGRDLVFETKAQADAYVTLNTDTIKTGTAVSVLNDAKDDYDLYVITPAKALRKVSFDAAKDLPEVTWAALKDKPTSTVTQIDDSVTFYEKFADASGILSYDGKTVAYVSDLVWDNIKNKPEFDTLYAAKSHTHEAADIKSIDFDNTTVTGVLPLDAIPAGAKEEVFKAASLDELATADWLEGKSVNKNDWISVAAVTDPVTKKASAKMYFVTDASKLGTADYAKGIEEIPLGTAAAVAWANVTDKPDFDGTYVAKSDVVTTVSKDNAGKVVAVNDDGKITGSITGDAATVGGKAPSAFAEAKHTHLAADITDKIPFSKLSNLPGTAKEHNITDVVLTSDVVTTANAENKGKVISVGNDGKLDASISGDAGTVGGHAAEYFATSDHNHSLNDLDGKLDWTKLDNTPTTIAGYGITDAAASSDITKVATANKALRLNAEAKLPASITGDAQTLQDHDASYFATADHGHALADLTGKLDWTKLENTPTTIAGYGITDAVNSSLLTDTASADNAGMLLKLNDAGKLDVTITGDAATVGGRTAASFADASHTHAMDDVTGLNDAIAGIKGNAATKTGSTVSYIDLSKTTFKGKISLDNIPAGALERMEIVASTDAMLLLTVAKVQQGDLIKVKAEKPADQKVYYVKDASKLSTDGTTPGTMDAFEEFPMGTAASVPWSGVTGAPDFANLYAPKNHTHTAAEVGAVPTTDVVTKATANKILKLDADGKLPTSITGDAATVGGKAASEFAAATHDHTASEITDFSDAVNKILTPAINAKGHVVVGSTAPSAATNLNKNDMYIQLL